MKIGRKEKEFIKLLFEGAIEFYSIFDPRFRKSYYYEKYLNTRPKRASYKKLIKKLNDKDLIYLGGDKIKLTKNGERLLKRFESEDAPLSIEPGRWDNVWRIIAYDIPEDFKKERDFLSLKLKQTGFYRVQKSFWAYPYECKEEIAVFAQKLGLSPFVIYLKTERLPNQTKIKEYFNLE